MADTTGYFIPTTGGPVVSSIDPFDFIATFAPLVADSTPPEVTLVSPAEGTDLRKFDPISVRVVDPELRFHCIFAYFPDTFGAYEVVMDGNYPVTRGMYNVSRTGTEGDYTYTFTRKAGWMSRPIISVKATDAGDGEEIS